MSPLVQAGVPMMSCYDWAAKYYFQFHEPKVEDLELLLDLLKIRNPFSF